MADKKKQHFVPQGYLKPWCDPSTPEGQTPYVWVYPKEGGEPKNKAPKNIFFETDLYTIKAEDGGRNLVLENGLSQLESEFCALRDRKVLQNKLLSEEEKLLFSSFAAAANSRTISFRDHQGNQWSKIVEKTEKFKQARDAATPAERRVMDSVLGRPPSKDSISLSQAREMASAPLQTMMPTYITALAPQLFRIDLAFLRTDDPMGFITSDSPCNWFDPEAYKRPPFYNQPGLGYKSIEIIIPISPTCCALFNRQGKNGYFAASDELVNESNRRIRFSAKDSFVVNRREFKESWFDPGEEPEDSWEKRQEREKDL